MFRVKRTDDIGVLYQIWFGAVKATHHFLSDADFDEIAEVVKEQYLPSADLLVYVDENDIPLAFMGYTENNMDSLFVDVKCHGQGIGRKFVEWMAERYDTVTVQVNVQNPSAHGFYNNCGFVDVRRDETDDAGRPFPIIHMELCNR